MTQWNSEQYLKFKDQRTQPAIDLAEKIKIKQPQMILDIGCGPGNSTFVLKERFPHADILGIDNSESMVQKAKESYPDMNFRICDISTEWSDLGEYDVIFSNACLQWIPDHKSLIPALFYKLNGNGILAVQIPINSQEPLFQIMDEIMSEPRWGISSVNVQANKILLPEEYFDILSSCTDDFDIWETVYYHHMLSIEMMVEWIKGTRLRPYLNILDKMSAEMLEKEIARRASRIYNMQKNGEIIFKFRRLFFVARNIPRKKEYSV